MSPPAESAASDAITLRLLGGFALKRRGQEGDGLAYEKARALLAYVAVESAMVHPRRRLAALFWPDLPSAMALGNLRQVLLNLRQVLEQETGPAPRLIIGRNAVRFDPDSLAVVDIGRFASAPASCADTLSSENCAACLNAMRLADAAYGGELLAGFSLPDCPEFEAWLQTRREAMQRQALGRLTELTECEEKRGEIGLALSAAQRYVHLAPWDEVGHRRAMRLYARCGQPGNALAQYASCCRNLEETFGVAPEAETAGLAERIRRESLAAPTDMLSSERRQVTILYCELSAEGVDDPDDIISLLTPIRRRLITSICRYSGHVVETFTGGILAYFGYPVASETAPRRALQAALALVRDRAAGIRMRVAVHTDRIIAGEPPAVPDTVGAATALTVRLRRCVESGEVAVSAATFRLTEGYFEGVSVGERQLPGAAQPLEIFRLSGETGANDRLMAAPSLTPLVGRAIEVEALCQRWQSARAGRSPAIMVRGDAGIGKSRLVLALREHVGPVCELRCQQEFDQSALHPFVALFDSLLGADETDDARIRFSRLASRIEAIAPTLLRSALPLFAGLLGLPVVAPHREPLTLPRQRRSDTLDALTQLVDSLAGGDARRPGLVVVEDLHWADPTTLEWLSRMLVRDDSPPLLVLLTARPDFRVPWPDNRVSVLPLRRLGDDEIATLVGELLPEAVPETLRRLAARADGIPLYAEELARTVAFADESAIPAGLQALLSAQLDRLGSAKATACLAACLGRSFSFDLLSRVSLQAPTLLAESLRQLLEAGFLTSDENGIYEFRHALFRDAAEQSQPRSERRQAHLRIAAVLRSGEADAGEYAESNAKSHAGAPAKTGNAPEVVAGHLEAGEAFPEAVRCWLRAGRLASRHSSHREAILHFKAGLRLIHRLPEDDDRRHLEFDLQYGLGLSAIALDGYAAPDAVAAHCRAEALCAQTTASPEMFRAIWGMWTSASSRAGYAHAAELAQKLQHMAETSGDRLELQQARFARGNTHFWQGNFSVARTEMEWVLAHCTREEGVSHIGLFGENVRVTAGAYLSWIRWFLGDQKAAVHISVETLAEARHCGHSFSLAYALVFAAILRCRQRLPREALSLAEEVMALASRHGFDLWQIGAILAHGWALALQGRKEGVGQIEQCIESLRVAMGGVTLAVLGPLATAHQLVGDYAAARTVAEEALALGAQLGDRHIEAELLCIQAESLLALSPQSAATARDAFASALTLSRQQGARLVEQRASEGLASLDGI